MKKPPVIGIVDAITRADIFAPWLTPRESWAAWIVVIKVVFGIPLDEAELATFHKHTGRNEPAPGGYFDATLIVGRRGGKSLILALIAAYLSAFVDWRSFLTGGEAGHIIVVAADRRQAAVIFAYLREMLSIPLLGGIVKRETNELLELHNGITIEITTANFKTIRGRTVVAALADELAFWVVDETGASPDKEVIAAIRPATLTIPGARLLKASSPYSRRGVLYEDYKRHFAKESATLVWQAGTTDMNPSVPQSFIEAAYADDPVSAAAEYGAQFRSDIENFVSREVVEACVVPGRYELAPLDSISSYFGFTDPSGGSSDSFTLCISHRENDHVVVDLLRETSPPLSPESVVADYAALLKRFRLSTVTSDRYAGQWVVEAFRRYGIQCEQAAKPKSDLYKDLLSVLNSGGVELLDHAKAITQICGLERRTARGGRDSIDHAPNAHDDLANAIAGAVVGSAVSQGGAAGWIEYYRRLNEQAGVLGDMLPPGTDVDGIRASSEHGWQFHRPDDWIELRRPPQCKDWPSVMIEGNERHFSVHREGAAFAAVKKSEARLVLTCWNPIWREAQPADLLRSLGITEESAA